MDHAASEEEVRAAALQFVRKISGYRKPSRVNEAIFTAAVDEISASSRRLLEGLAANGHRHPSPRAAGATIPLPGKVAAGTSR
jgi:hypothetical protein